MKPINIKSLNILNESLRNATTAATFFKGVKIKLVINSRNQSLTRNAIVQLASRLNIDAESAKDFNEIFKSLETKADQDIKNKNAIARLIIKIKQLFGNMRYKRNAHFPLPVPAEPVKAPPPAPKPEEQLPDPQQDKHEEAPPQTEPPVDLSAGVIAPPQPAVDVPAPVKIRPAKNLGQNKQVDAIKKQLFALFQINYTSQQILQKSGERLNDVEQQIETLSNAFFPKGENFMNGRPIAYIIHRGDEDIRLVVPSRDQQPSAEFTATKNQIIDYLFTGESIEDVLWKTVGVQELHFRPKVALPVQEPVQVPVPEPVAEPVQEPVEQTALVPVETPTAPATGSYSSYSFIHYVGSSLYAIPGQVASAAGNMFDYAYKYVDEGLKMVYQANNYRKQIKAGIDLYPLFIEAYKKGADGSNALIDYWNSPTEKIDPLTANLMHGCAERLGKHIKTLAINAVRLKASGFAGDLAVQFNLAPKAGAMMADRFLAFTNPLGWIDTALMFSSQGLNLAKGFKKGILAKLHQSIDFHIMDLTEKASLNPQYMEFLLLENLKEGARNAFLDEKKAFIQILREQGKAPEEVVAKGFIEEIKKAYNEGSPQPWFIENEKDAPRSYHQAKKAFAELEKTTANFSRQLGEKDRPESLKDEAKYYGLLNLAVTLKNTSTKTLKHLVEDLQAKLDDQEMPEVTKQGSKAVLHSMFFGRKALPLDAANQIAKPFREAYKDIGSFKNVMMKPFGAALNLAPEAVKEGIHQVLDPASRLLGEAVGDAVFNNFTEEMIQQFNLDNIQLFREEELELHLHQRVKGTPLEPVYDIARYIFAIDREMAVLLQQGGCLIADLLAEQMAHALLQSLPENTRSQYTTKKLLSELVEVGFIQRGSAVVGRLFGNFMQNVGAGADNLRNVYRVVKNNEYYPSDF